VVAPVVVVAAAVIQRVQAAALELQTRDLLVAAVQTQ
jgi:hypothetical protein